LVPVQFHDGAMAGKVDDLCACEKGALCRSSVYWGVEVRVGQGRLEQLLQAGRRRDEECAGRTRIKDTAGTAEARDSQRQRETAVAGQDRAAESETETLCRRGVEGRRRKRKQHSPAVCGRGRAR
jgi:hypothetical protein